MGRKERDFYKKLAKLNWAESRMQNAASECRHVETSSSIVSVLIASREIAFHIKIKEPSLLILLLKQLFVMNNLSIVPYFH